MGKQHYINICIRLFLFLLNGLGIVLAFQNQFLLSGWGLSLFLCLQIFLFIDYLNGQFLDIEKSIDCLLYDDFSNTIPEHKKKYTLHRKMSKLLDIYRKKNLQETSDKLIFTNIIESLSIGVLILKKDENNIVEVFQQNSAFLNILHIPKYMNWELLQPKLQALDPFINPNTWESRKHTVSLHIKNQEENFFLKTSYTQTASFEYLILTLETIQQLIEKKEKESWYKLMNVMSHEIINTITPISSLAENLGLLIQEPTLDADTISELSQGLKIINKRSTHLNNFVNTYRKLTELPQPQKANMNLTELVNHTLKLLDSELKENDISYTFQADQSYYIYADKSQIEQVLINLLSNAVNALNQTAQPKISLCIYQEGHRIFLEISDNGHGISDEIKANIFIPYFTTRKDGSGIGLTLSKNILNAHNSFLILDSEAADTTFKISFPSI